MSLPSPSRVPSIVKRLGWVSLFTDVASDMVYPLLPALLRSFGGTAVWLGVMEGIAEAASAIVKWRIGPWVDRSPRKKPLILAGYALATVVRPLIAFASSARAAAPAHAAPAARLPAPVRRYLLVLGLFTLGASADSFLLLRAVEIGMNEAWAPLLWLALGGAKAASNLPGGWLADRIGRKRTLVGAWLLYAVFYAAAPHVTTPIPFALLVVAYGTYYGLAEGSERALLAEQAPPAMRGRAFGAMHAITGLAVLPANLLFGLLYAKHVSYAFGASAACAAAAAVLLVLTVKEPQHAPESGTLSS